MLKGFSTSCSLIRLLFFVLALTMGALSHAAATLVGGGATLPAIGYVGSGAATTYQVFPAASNSLFGAYSATRGYPQVSYCQTGSLVAKNMLSGLAAIPKTPGPGYDTYNIQYACPFVPGNVNEHGFGANAAGVNRSDLTAPSFIGSTSPLSSVDISNYQAGHGSGTYPVQFPAVAGAIAIGMNVRTAKGVSLNSSNTNFSDAQLCRVFSGAVTNWSDPSLASAYTLDYGDSIPPTPIKLQYRSDGSGSTFSFSNHLTAVCPAIAGIHFLTSEMFTTVVSQFFTANGVETLPSNWSGNIGDQGQASYIQATYGSIGYISMANALAAGIGYAKVNGVDPATFGSPVTVASAALKSNYVISSNTWGVNGQPLIAAVPGAPSNSCLELIDPSTYASPSSGYPIIAFSYLLGNSSGNPSGDLWDIRNLIGAPYNVAITGRATQFGIGTGLALLNVPGTVLSTMTVNRCVN
ncbi:MAG TPA: substrate-binding domain-containing protein [Candidatus Saccharimonadales bacterium]|nr:substrate-binding domain-containing protein [Candidatus Saccharimonadales bacterium]